MLVGSLFLDGDGQSAATTLRVEKSMLRTSDEQSAKTPCLDGKEGGQDASNVSDGGSRAQGRRNLS